MKKTETKKPTVGTKKPFWDGRSRASTPGYREKYNSIFKQRKTLNTQLKQYKSENLNTTLRHMTVYTDSHQFFYNVN